MLNEVLNMAEYLELFLKKIDLLNAKYESDELFSYIDKFTKFIEQHNNLLLSNNIKTINSKTEIINIL
jgi:hypothetical protein